MHEFGNKSGPLLARSIKLQQSQRYVSRRSCPSQGLVYTSEAIAKAFQLYYSSLYNISATSMGTHNYSTTTPLTDYLQSTALSTLSAAAKRGTLKAIQGHGNGLCN